MATNDMGPEQFVATLDVWVPGWVTDDLSAMACPTCNAALSGDALAVTSERTWRVRSKSFGWLHLIHVTCTECQHVLRFDIQGLAAARNVDSKRYIRGQTTAPAPDSSVASVKLRNALKPR